MSISKLYNSIISESVFQILDLITLNPATFYVYTLKNGECE